HAVHIGVPFWQRRREMLAWMSSECTAIARRLLLPERNGLAHSTICETLRRYGSGALGFALERGIRVAPLRKNERYAHASPALQRLGIDVDAWPAPPAGLFVVEERTVYLRSRSPMTVAHEFGHALDCALGGGIYRSGIDPRIGFCFSTARAFVTPYAATGIDEYFAEALRAFVEANDPASAWPRATRTRLQRIDPAMFDFVCELFAADFRSAA
ncbi:MAG: hypothetical protein ACYDGM_09275, partial [Vulcanimicrobiaceae bacterium]